METVVVDVERAPDADGVRGSLGRPSPRARVGERIAFIGWAFGRASPVRWVELVRGDEILARVEPDVERPDVAASFGDAPRDGRCGLEVAIPTAAALEGTILVRAVLERGDEAALARVRARRAAELDAHALPSRLLGDVDIPMTEARHRIRSSPVTRWAALTHEEPPLGSAWQRISDHRFFEPLIRPEFTIDPQDRVFTIGSCFARNAEAALALLGMNVVSRTAVFDHYGMRDAGEPRSFTNKYNTEAIRNELRWALEDGGGFPPEAVIRMPDGRFQDRTAARTSSSPTRRPPSSATPAHGADPADRRVPGRRDHARPERGLLRHRDRPLHERHAVGRAGAVPLPRPLVPAGDGGPRGDHGLLTEHGHPDLQIVVTVSPVPMWATFTGQDVVVANTSTRSLLRAAAGSWSREHADVHDFPGYEIVLNSERSVVWERDGRHVRPPFVRQIMDLFVRTHVAGRAS